MGKCKLCKGTITGRDWKKHQKFNEILGIKMGQKGSLTQFCGGCVKKMLDFSDNINAPQEKYDWRGCKAKLNYDRIMKKADPEYIEFVETHRDDIFTLCIRDESTDEKKLDRQLLDGQYMFKELPDMTWNFHCSDLIITKNGVEHEV
jgi:hypothetical protein